MPATRAKGKDEFRIGEREYVFVEKYTVRGLRRAVDVELAQRGERHRDAAARAGVTSEWWSRTLHSKEITEKHLKTLARGLGLSFKQLMEKVERKS